MQKLIGQAHVVLGTFAQAVTSITSDVISLKNYAGVSIIVGCDVTSGTDDGALTIEQMTDVANSQSDNKALDLNFQWQNLDTESAEALTKTAVVSDTFNVGGVTKSTLYVMEIKTEDLDVQNNFDCLRVNIATVTNGIGFILFVLHTPRYRDQVPADISSITD